MFLTLHSNNSVSRRKDLGYYCISSRNGVKGCHTTKPSVQSRLQKDRCRARLEARQRRGGHVGHLNQRRRKGQRGHRLFALVMVFLDRNVSRGFRSIAPVGHIATLPQGRPQTNQARRTAQRRRAGWNFFCVER